MLPLFKFITKKLQQYSENNKIRHMKTFSKVFLIALMIYQISSLDTGMVLVKNLTGNTPAGIFKIGILSNAKLVTVASVLPTRYVNVYVMTKTRMLQAENLLPLHNYTFTIQPSTQIIYLFIHGFIPQFSVEVVMDNITLSSIDPYALGWYNPSLKELAIHKYIEIKNNCTIQVDTNYFSVPYQTNTNTWLSFYNFSVAQNIAKGVYLLEIYKKGFDLNDIDTPYSIPIYSKKGSECEIEEVYFCMDGYWAYPTYPDICKLIRGDTCSIDGKSTVISGCQNNILNYGESCDYAGDGCGSDCQPAPGYQCFPNNTCSLLCGNSKVQTGEQCDNGNKPGCVSCKVAPPYKCKNVQYAPSVCFICGNSIFQPGEECDNGNLTGCTNCTRDRGYTCINKLKSLSKCRNICGDGLLVPEEECDNGNTTGCINCIKSPGYTCKNILLKQSKCYNCGNYILEAGEDCDNSNKNGCKNCVTQPGWNCKTDPRYCYLKNKVCGNGQREIEELCDDGNKMNGDGCSSVCRTQIGYSCSVGLGEKSVCSKLAL